MRLTVRRRARRGIAGRLLVDPPSPAMRAPSSARTFLAVYAREIGLHGLGLIRATFATSLLVERGRILSDAQSALSVVESGPQPDALSSRAGSDPFWCPRAAQDLEGLPDVSACASAWHGDAAGRAGSPGEVERQFRRGDVQLFDRLVARPRLPPRGTERALEAA